MPLAARGSRARAERSREGGAGEASGSRSPSSSQCWQRAPGRSRSRSRSRDGRGRGETVCECWGLVSLACHSSGAGWSPLWGGCRREYGGPGSGVGTVAVVAVGVCMHLGARLGLRGGRGAPRLGCCVMQQYIASLRPDSQDVGGKGPLSYFPFRKILLVTVFLGCLPLCAHTFSLVTVEEGAGCGGFLPLPCAEGRPGTGIGSRSAGCQTVGEAGPK